MVDSAIDWIARHYPHKLHGSGCKPEPAKKFTFPNVHSFQAGDKPPRYGISYRCEPHKTGTESRACPRHPILQEIRSLSQVSCSGGLPIPNYYRVSIAKRRKFIQYLRGKHSFLDLFKIRDIMHETRNLPVFRLVGDVLRWETSPFGGIFVAPAFMAGNGGG